MKIIRDVGVIRKIVTPFVPHKEKKIYIWDDGSYPHKDYYELKIGDTEPEGELVEIKPCPSYGFDHVGYTMRVGRTALEITGDSIVVGQAINVREIRKEIGEFFKIEPHKSLLVGTLESVNMPDNVVGFIYGKSTYQRYGVITKAAIIDPFYRGRLYILLHNTNDVPVYIPVGGGLITVVFAYVDGLSQYDGHYQDGRALVELYGES